MAEENIFLKLKSKEIIKMSELQSGAKKAGMKVGPLELKENSYV